MKPAQDTLATQMLKNTDIIPDDDKTYPAKGVKVKELAAANQSNAGHSNRAV
jgi:hypothetical protein